MKGNKFFVAAVLSLLLLALSTEGQAQRVVIEGSNLNIGSGNNLDGSLVGRPVGNAIGLNNILYSAHTLTVGISDTIDEYSLGAVALGMSNYVGGEAAMAFGRSVKVFGNDGIGIGHHIRVNGLSGGMVIGGGIAGEHGSDAYLVNDSSNSLAVGFNSTRPTLFVGASPNNYGQGVLNKTGRVAIGDVMPQAKLHIRSDDGEDAGIILAPYDPEENSSFIRFRDAQHSITVDHHGDMDIAAGTGNALGIASQNFKVDGDLVAIGTNGFTLAKSTTSSIGLNAYPSNGFYMRSGLGPSYVMEFGGTSFKLRTAVYEDPRNDIINNWSDAVTVSLSGAITLNGRVGVNAENTTNDYALAVDGGVLTTKVHIQEVGDWPDYVFREDYRPMPMDELSAYIGEHRHLPGVPSEAEVDADGYDVAAMQAVMLEKIEELTLYVLGQQREIDSLRTLVTVRFGYDACGNRTSRTLEFSRTDGGHGADSEGLSEGETVQWQASLVDDFAGAEAMLFPNPTEGGFFLSLTGGAPENTKATLCSVDGRVLEERVVTGAVEEFDLVGKPAGVYLLSVIVDGETRVWKVIKRN